MIYFYNASAETRSLAELLSKDQQEIALPHNKLNILYTLFVLTWCDIVLS